jgi:hypothetical protein
MSSASSVPSNFEDKGFFRRKFPRRAFHRMVGVLIRGHYSIYETGEIGEGGLSVIGDSALTEGFAVALTFQIPGGDFVSLRGTVRSCRDENGRFLHGLSFENIPFSHKRQIRSFVSERSENDEVIF